MKNRIRGIPLVLLLVALLTAACGAIKNTTSEQTASSEQSSFGAQLEAQAAAVHDTHRHAQEQTQTDSTTTRREYTEPVPEERTDMTIPTQSLLDLPDGAKYSAQNGRASIEAERQGDKMQAYRARADSLLSAAALTRRTDERMKRPPATWYRWLLAGFLAGGTATALLTKTNPLKSIVKLIKNIV